jgi:hypothetical protein
MANYPDRYRHVFKLIRDMRGGKDYDSQWGTRMKGTGPDGLDDRPPVRDRLREARPQQAAFEIDDRSFRPAEAQRAAAEFVLVKEGRPACSSAGPARRSRSSTPAAP